MGCLTLYGIPLHAVLSGDLTELALDNGREGVVLEMVVVDLSTKVELSLGLELIVKAAARLDGAAGCNRLGLTDRGRRAAI